MGSHVSRAFGKLKSTAVFSCCYDTGRLSIESLAWKLTDRDQYVLVAMVKRKLRMFSLCPIGGWNVR